MHSSFQKHLLKKYYCLFVLLFCFLTHKVSASSLSEYAPRYEYELSGGFILNNKNINESYLNIREGERYVTNVGYKYDFNRKKFYSGHLTMLQKSQWVICISCLPVKRDKKEYCPEARSFLYMSKTSDDKISFSLVSESVNADLIGKKEIDLSKTALKDKNFDLNNFVFYTKKNEYGNEILAMALGKVEILNLGNYWSDNIPRRSDDFEMATSYNNGYTCYIRACKIPKSDPIKFRSKKQQPKTVVSNPVSHPIHNQQNLVTPIKNTIPTQTGFFTKNRVLIGIGFFGITIAYYFWGRKSTSYDPSRRNGRRQ